MMDMQSLADERDAQEERAEESARGLQDGPRGVRAWFAEHRLRSMDVDVDFQFASDTFGVEDGIPF